MSQAKPTEQKRGSRREWMLLFLCLGAAILLCFCLVGTVALSISGFPRKLNGDLDEAKNRSDITVLSQAVVNFQTKFSLDYLPSRFVLCETLADYMTGMNDPNPAIAQLYSDSYSYLTRLFPRINWNTVHTPMGVNPPPPWAGIDWNGDSLPSPNVILEGDQCLVFFLAGFNTNGFSSNPPNPAQIGGERFGPFFDFKLFRLVDPGRATSPGYRVYIDPYGKSPYVYFSSYKVRNGYNRYASLGSDCSSVPQGPYNDGAGNYYNPDSFQIISAGRDTRFGPGGVWTPAKAADIDPDGRDDMSNFHATLLGNAR